MDLNKHVYEKDGILRRNFANETYDLIRQWSVNDLRRDEYSLIKEGDSYYLFACGHYESSQWYGVEITKKEAEKLQECDFEVVSDFFEEKRI